MEPPLSVIKIVDKNILLINNIIVYCLSLLPSVLFKKLTAVTVVFYFTRCHLKTFDNCHVITIHIQYTIALEIILTWTDRTRFNVFRYIACYTIHLVILFNIFKLHSR